MALPQYFTLWDVLYTTARLLFSFWLLVVLAPLSWRRSQLRGMLILWVFCALIRIAIAFDANPMFASLVIPEPGNTVLFLLTCGSLMLLWFARPLLVTKFGKLIRPR